MAQSHGVGAGSEFGLRLPRLRDDSIASREVSAATSAAIVPARRILVVDDNKDAANSLATLLRLKGHDVRVALSGAKALEAASFFRPRIVFLDIGMPNMDGYEVAVRFRELPHGKEALTGWGQPEDKLRAQSAGFDHHLVKPVEPDILQRLVAQS